MELAITRNIPKPRPYTGIWLQQAIKLDTSCPGFLAKSFAFGPFKRQVLFAVLSTLDWDHPQELAARVAAAAPSAGRPKADPLEVIARAILTMNAKVLLRAACGSVPGFGGTLARLGPDPIAETHQPYLSLLHMFTSSDPGDRARARVLGQISGPLTGDLVAVVSALNPVFLHPLFVRSVNSVQVARSLNHPLVHLQAMCSAATDAAIRQSVEQNGTKSVRAWVRRWALRFDRLLWPSPIVGDPSLIVLATGSAMIDAGREGRFSNCIATKAAEVLTGRYSYVEHRPSGDPKQGGIAELRRTTQGWLLDAMYGRGNQRLSKAAANVLRANLVAQGVAVYDQAPGDPDVLRDTAKLLRLHHGEQMDIGGWGALCDLGELEAA